MTEMSGWEIIKGLDDVRGEVRAMAARSGEDYEGMLATYRDQVRERMARDEMSPLTATTHLALEAYEFPYQQLYLIAAGLDVAERVADVTVAYASSFHLSNQTHTS